MTFEEALEHPFVNQHASFIYKTPSHTEEHHRFRIVCQTARTINDRAETKAAQKGLIRKLGGDESCKDACRVFYGSKGSNPVVLGNVLSNDELDRLIALGRDPASTPEFKNSDGKRTSHPIVARRSGVEISPEQLVTSADGHTGPFELASFGENIHCPVHIDRNPSAFVVQSKEGNKGAYCHSCAATFWMKSPRSARPSFDFYRADTIIRQMEYEQDPDSHYDEDDAPPGLIEQVRAERTARTLSQKFLKSAGIPFSSGVTFLSSEKGSGKSSVFEDKVAALREMGLSVLLVGHRQTLLQSMAARLGLTCYFYLDGCKYKNNQPTPYYAICVDSMFKLLKPMRHKYDVVILDESEQIFGHLTGSTLRDKRRACYMQLFHYLAVAKHVFVADADLGAITVEGVYQAMGPKAEFQFFMNEYRQGNRSQRDFHHYGSEPHLTQDMLAAIGAGGRFYVATNSINKANELQAAIRIVHGDGPKIMLVTAKTTGLKEVQEFIKDIKTEILNYDVVIASPTLGTGIDITFPDAAQHIDTVYGFFVTRVNTHFDIDQQLARVRHPKAVKVWIAPDTFTFETEPAVILQEAKLNGVLNDSLIGYRHDGSKSVDETYLNVYAHVTSIARASKNSLRKNLLELRARNGWNLVAVDVDQKGEEIGKVVKGVAKEAVEEKRVADICTAERLSAESYDLLRENTSPLTKEEDDAMQRYEVENFYREDASAPLLALDNKGAYRRQLGLLEIYLSPTDRLVTKDFRESELATIVTDRKKRTLKQLMLKEMLTRAGLADTDNPIKLDKVISSADLGEFAKFCEENSGRLQDLFGMPVRDDIRERPMMQLGVVLRRFGLSMQNCETKKVGKDKIYYYRVKLAEWENAAYYLRRRMQKDDPAMQFLTA
nr:plasmid replication protein, CyRepA1 family [Massilia sp. H27-R4]